MKNIFRKKDVVKDRTGATFFSRTRSGKRFFTKEKVFSFLYFCFAFFMIFLLLWFVDTLIDEELEAEEGRGEPCRIYPKND